MKGCPIQTGLTLVCYVYILTGLSGKRKGIPDFFFPSLLLKASTVFFSNPSYGKHNYNMLRPVVARLVKEMLPDAEYANCWRTAAAHNSLQANTARVSDGSADWGTAAGVAQALFYLYTVGQQAHTSAYSQSAVIKWRHSITPSFVSPIHAQSHGWH